MNKYYITNKEMISEFPGDSVSRNYYDEPITLEDGTVVIGDITYNRQLRWTQLRRLGLVVPPHPLKKRVGKNIYDTATSEVIHNNGKQTLYRKPFPNRIFFIVEDEKIIPISMQEAREWILDNAPDLDTTDMWKYRIGCDRVSTSGKKIQSIKYLLRF